MSADNLLQHPAIVAPAPPPKIATGGAKTLTVDETKILAGMSHQRPATAGDLVDLHRNAPKPDVGMLYGLTGDVANAAAKTTEANRFAVAAGFLTFLSAAVGRNAYLPVGNIKHHARQFALHVGRTARGRKGEALSLVQLIRLKIEEQHRKQAGDMANPICGGHHSGGLSTREGLALLIHDGYKSGKDDVPPILDKRIWVVESEFSNVLQQGKRDGNTLSSALRDAWDGVSIRPATKSSPLWASDPHIALSAAITPSELLGLTASRELSNGFANRFTIFWAERERIEPFPKPTPTSVVEELAQRTAEVIRFAVGSYPTTTDSMQMALSEDAQKRYALLYRGELSAVQDGEKVTALLERRPPMLLRLAMLFALTDKVKVIEVRHLDAALAWSRFHRDSVRFIFNDAAGEDAARESTDAARKILEYLKLHNKTSRSDLMTKCFAGHLPAQRVNDALDILLMNSPPAIEVVEGERAENGKCPKFYRLCEIGELANLTTSKGSVQVRSIANLANLEPEPTKPSSPISQSSQVGEAAEIRTNRASSPNSPISRPLMKNEETVGVR